MVRLYLDEDINNNALLKMKATKAMAESAKKIVVCGGNGFLGSRICKYAVERGWDVTSIRYVGLSK